MSELEHGGCITVVRPAAPSPAWIARDPLALHDWRIIRFPGGTGYHERTWWYCTRCRDIETAKTP